MADMNELQQKLAGIREQIKNQLNELKDSRGVYEYRKNIMDGKAGLVGTLMRETGKLPKEDRAEYGKAVNRLKDWVSEQFEELDRKLKEAELNARYETEKIDVTLPAKKQETGNLHPITKVTNEIIDIFSAMGFDIYEGTEIENDYYNFTALNTPQDHPARDMQDTFYLTDEFLLRTQTSAGQIHVMENKKPPIKILSPGKVFR